MQHAPHRQKSFVEALEQEYPPKGPPLSRLACEIRAQWACKSSLLNIDGHSPGLSTAGDANFTI